MKRRCFVISATNLTEGGPLSILQDFVAAACETLPADWDIVVFVNRRSHVAAARPLYIELPHAKRSWFQRLWVEWFEFRRHAARLQPDLWVSLQDTSPNVGRVPQAVYVHNPVPFYPMRWRDAFYEPKHAAFKLGYGLLYRVNLRRNCAVVVQQSWLRDRFSAWAGPATQIVVANPSTPPVSRAAAERGPRQPGAATFFYPALPRTFKNFELIGESLALLEAGCDWCSEVLLTFDGSENRFARWVKSRFGGLRTLRFLGRQTRPEVEKLYRRADCLLFPSRIETWGLPISEAQQHHLPILVADLPYARETVGTYDRVEFIDIDDPEGLAERLLAFQQGTLTFQPVVMPEPRQPFVRGFPELVEILTRDCRGRVQ